MHQFVFWAANEDAQTKQPEWIKVIARKAHRNASEAMVQKGQQVMLAHVGPSVNAGPIVADWAARNGEEILRLRFGFVWFTPNYIIHVS